jgi:hypothetical protein
MKLQDVDLAKIEQKTCCGVFEAIWDCGYRFPFDKPMSLNFEKHDIGEHRWAIRLMKTTSYDNPTKKNSKMMFLAYCPFCGEKLEKDGLTIAVNDRD